MEGFYKLRKNWMLAFISAWQPRTDMEDGQNTYFYLHYGKDYL